MARGEGLVLSREACGKHPRQWSVGETGAEWEWIQGPGDRPRLWTFPSLGPSAHRGAWPMQRSSEDPWSPGKGGRGRSKTHPADPREERIWGRHCGPMAMTEAPFRGPKGFILALAMAGRGSLASQLTSNPAGSTHSIQPTLLRQVTQPECLSLSCPDSPEGATGSLVAPKTKLSGLQPRCCPSGWPCASPWSSVSSAMSQRVCQFLSVTVSGCLGWYPAALSRDKAAVEVMPGSGLRGRG